MITSASSLQQQFVGDDVRESKWHAAPLASFDYYGRVGSSPGHFETHGIPTSQHVSYHGPPISSFDQYGRVGTSPGSFETQGSRSTAAGRSYVIGDTVRETRTSYAPFDHHGRVGTLGEIGTEGNNKIGNSKMYIPASSSSYMSRNSIARGGSGSSSYSSTPVKKAGYGLGGWKK